MANLPRGLIVSCQAVKGEPLYGLGIMRYMARAAVQGGAVGIRANGVADIHSIKEEVNVPVIGIIKEIYPDSDVYITPTLKEVKELIASEADVIALDCTGRPRPNGETLEALVTYIRKNAPEKEIMADTARAEDAEEAHRLGFDYIGSTMRGYTAETKGVELPDYGYLKKLVETYKDTKIIAEGGIWETGQLKKVCQTGVYTVVVGSSITRPADITKRFTGVMELC